jgi:hypothetical protein
MSMILLMLGSIALCALPIALASIAEKHRRRLYDQQRSLENLRRRVIHAQAGSSHYPHTMDNGQVRWYPVARDYAVDL